VGVPVVEVVDVAVVLHGDVAAVGAMGVRVVVVDDVGGAHGVLRSRVGNARTVRAAGGATS
jgi:hypothetical protein